LFNEHEANTTYENPLDRKKGLYCKKQVRSACING